MYIKIYNKSQLILLEQMNPLLGKYEIPLELLGEVERILKCEKIGKKGFIAILLNPVKGDIQEILNVLDCYPQKLKICSEVERIEVSDNRLWMTKRRHWYKDCFKVKGEKSKVFVVYSLRLRSYYDE